jgi:hypothetical protein
MRTPTRPFAWLGLTAAFAALTWASLIPSPPASASTASRSAQVLDPTLQVLATQAAQAVTEVALIPTPNPTDVARVVNQAGALTIQAALTTTGAVELSLPYTNQLLDIAGIRPDLVSCASFARGITNSDGRSFSVPTPAVSTTPGDHAIVVPATVSPYDGPTTYAAGSGVHLSPGIGVDGTYYVIADDSAYVHVTVNSDGSGSMSFANLRAGSLDSAQTVGSSLSGQEVWTCSQMTGQ